MTTSDGRILFFLPWQNHTIVGTTDTPSSIKDWPAPTEDEIQWILNEVEKYLSRDLKVRRSDVLSAWNGIRPLVAVPPPSSSLSKGNDKNANLPTASISRDHTCITNGDSNTVTITGGKWTTYREMAEDAVDEVLKINPDIARKALPCSTLKIPLIGAENYTPNLPILLAQQFGLTQSVCVHLAHTYGSRAEDVLKLVYPTLGSSNKGKAQQWPVVGDRIVPGYPYLEAEIMYAIKEHCRSVSDMLAHRTRLAFLNVESAKKAIPKVASVMKEQLGWNGDREAQEVSCHCHVNIKSSIHSCTVTWLYATWLTT